MARTCTVEGLKRPVKDVLEKTPQNVHGLVREDVGERGRQEDGILLDVLVGT